MKVSVWMSAYNHEKYISHCLDSVLNQKTNFEFEIVLGEDCSTDRTREIVLDYNKRYPGRFSLYLPEKNIGMMEMDIATGKLCRGEYIALLNGDDLWTDENKLQVQSDFLDSNPDTVMCYHKARVENDTDGSSFDTVYPESGEELSTEYLLLGYNPVMTPTVMIRNVLKIPDWFAEMPYGDMPLYLLLSKKGRIRYIDRLMSVYRIHSEGQWQGDSLINNLMKDLKFYEFMNRELNYEHDKSINLIFAQRYFDLVRLNINRNNLTEAEFYFKKLTSANNEFLNLNNSEISSLRKILYENADIKDYNGLLSGAVKWKVN